MHQDDLFGLEAIPTLSQLFKRYVRVGLFLQRCALHNQRATAARESFQAGTPPGVARDAETVLSHVEAVADRRWVMFHRDRIYGEAFSCVDPRTLFDLQLVVAHSEGPVLAETLSVADSSEGFQVGACTARAVHIQRLRALLNEEEVEDEKRPTSDVVSVKMGDEDAVDVLGWRLVAVGGECDRWSHVDEKR